MNNGCYFIQPQAVLTAKTKVARQRAINAVYKALRDLRPFYEVIEVRGDDTIRFHLKVTDGTEYGSLLKLNHIVRRASRGKFQATWAV